MKIIHKITKQEAIEAYRQLNQVSEEITVEIESETISTSFTPGSGSLRICNTPKPAPMPLYTPLDFNPQPTYC